MLKGCRMGAVAPFRIYFGTDYKRTAGTVVEDCMWLIAPTVVIFID